MYILNGTPCTLNWWIEFQAQSERSILYSGFPQLQSCIHMQFIRTASERSELRAKRAAHEVSEAVLYVRSERSCSLVTEHIRLLGDPANSHMFWTNMPFFPTKCNQTWHGSLFGQYAGHCVVEILKAPSGEKFI